MLTFLKAWLLSNNIIINNLRKYIFLYFWRCFFRIDSQMWDCSVEKYMSCLASQGHDPLLKGCATLYSHQQCMRMPVFLFPCQWDVLSCFYMFAYLISERQQSSNLHFFNYKLFEDLFICLNDICFKINFMFLSSFCFSY